MICENCGMAVLETARFCSGCGLSPVHSADVSSVTADPRATQTPVTALFVEQPASQAFPSIACVGHPRTVAAGACVGCGNFFCRECLTNSDNRNYCRNCVGSSLAHSPRSPGQLSNAGVHYSQAAFQQTHPSHYTQQYAKRKEPALALFLSFFLPGLGQIYNGDVGKGIGFMVGFWILIWIGVGIIFWIWAMIDAYQCATNINLGRRR